MIYIIEVRDMGRPPGGNELKSLHYREYKSIRDAWQLALRDCNVVVKTPCELTVTVYSSGKMDLDNAAGCAKIPLDCLQRLGILEEDNTDHITKLTVLHEKCRRKEAGIKLEFLPL